METQNLRAAAGDYDGPVIGPMSRRILAVVVVTAVIARAFLRNGLDGALGATIALGVGALILSLLAAHYGHQGG